MDVISASILMTPKLSLSSQQQDLRKHLILFNVENEHFVEQLLQYIGVHNTILSAIFVYG